jgi:hypothetical protein
VERKLSQYYKKSRRKCAGLLYNVIKRNPKSLLEMAVLSPFIWSEIFQGITANQPGESGAYQGEYPFENGHHAGLLNAVWAAVRGRWKRILLLLT